jgi:hypothetical protein
MLIKANLDLDIGVENRSGVSEQRIMDALPAATERERRAFEERVRTFVTGMLMYGEDRSDMVPEPCLEDDYKDPYIARNLPTTIPDPGDVP